MATGRPEPVFYNGFRAGEDVRGPSSAADAGAFGTISRSEASNALRRAVFFHRQGEIRDRTFENQSFRASAGP